MNQLIDEKIAEAQEILKTLELPEQQQNKLSGLTLLALANIQPDQKWSEATTKGMTLSKDIMEFVNEHYKTDYKANTRESFRKIALKPFVEYNLAVLNPDEPDLKPSSSRTHYALSDLGLETIRKFGGPEWGAAVETFKANQYARNTPKRILLRKVIVRNFKSILDAEVELGRVNVFIGANGSGKSNFLEALAVVASAKAGDLNLEGLYSRGVRIARPDLMLSSFMKLQQKENIDFELTFQDGNVTEVLKSSLYPEDKDDIYTKWSDKETGFSLTPAEVKTKVDEVFNEYFGVGEGLPSPEELLDAVFKKLGVEVTIENTEYRSLLSEYAIFDLNTKTLRGITPSDSRKTPLGINGEGLDLLIATFNAYEKGFLDKTSTALFEWIEKILNEKDEKVKFEGLKAGRSASTLYFSDRYMLKKNNTFSAENSNEGILHVLFYLALFISTKTPTLFAIDNIETALNPKLCKKLITLIADLSKERGKQVLITTHNPAILDGLNLLEDEQRLFEVKRDSEGRTTVRRIKFKSDLSDKKYKLSDMWLKGLIGAIPENF